MDILARARELDLSARHLHAKRLAEKDLAWWAKAIAHAASIGRTTVSDEQRLLIYHPARATPLYLQALSALLGEGFSVDAARAWTSTGYDIIRYDCVKVSWQACGGDNG